MRTTHAHTDMPATRNEAYGFWGTMHEHAATAWPLAIITIAETTSESYDTVRAFLDSRHGRHFADDVRDRLHVGDRLDDAVRFATARWMAWTINCRTSREYDIPRGLPYLHGMVIHCGIAEDAMAD